MRESQVNISGFVKPGFEAVQEAFTDNFQHRGELGAACSIYHRGEQVVDLRRGIRDKKTGEPWEADTIASALERAMPWRDRIPPIHASR